MSIQKTIVYMVSEILSSSHQCVDPPHPQPRADRTDNVKNNRSIGNLEKNGHRNKPACINFLWRSTCGLTNAAETCFSKRAEIEPLSSLGVARNRATQLPIQIFPLSALASEQGRRGLTTQGGLQQTELIKNTACDRMVHGWRHLPR
jgi:hypothetical protein